MANSNFHRSRRKVNRDRSSTPTRSSRRDAIDHMFPMLETSDVTDQLTKQLHHLERVGLRLIGDPKRPDFYCNGCESIRWGFVDLTDPTTLFEGWDVCPRGCNLKLVARNRR
jgi:hypothetical protein